ncbi:extracellular solute-binding protein [Chloroflexia bacterium SDU3-3]|nr:extracellular solute-binding protein [Chloroflexia bacterium SDU3-3]
MIPLRECSTTQRSSAPHGIRSHAMPFYQSRLVATTLLSITLLAGCSTPTSQRSPPAPTAAPTQAIATVGAPAETAASATPVTIRVAWWGSQTRHDRTLKAIELFEQAYPNIDIVPEYSSFDDYWTKLSSQVESNDLPDVINQDYARISDWISRDLLMPLDPLVADSTINLTDVADEQIAGGRLRGKLYGLSLGTNSPSILYDPALFKAAGLEEPTADWTWSDLQRDAISIHQKLGIYGVEDIYKLDMFKLFLKEHGAWIYNERGTGLGYNNDAIAATFFQSLIDLQKAGAIPSQDFDANHPVSSVEDSLMVKGQAAMLFIWSNQAVAVNNAVKDRQLALVQTPRVAGGSEGLYLKPAMFFSISAKTQHPKEAAMFIDFFLNSPEANTVLAAERGVPILPSVRKAIRSSLPPMQQQVFAYIGDVESVAAPINPPDPTAHTKVLSEVYNPLVNQLIRGEISAADAAALFRKQATALLAAK